MAEEVRQCWPTSKSIWDIVPITLALSKHMNPFNKTKTTIAEKTVSFNDVPGFLEDRMDILCNTLVQFGISLGDGWECF